MINPGSAIYSLIHAAGGINKFGGLYIWGLIVATVAVGVWRFFQENRVRKEVQSFTKSLQSTPDDARFNAGRWFSDHPRAKLRVLWAQYQQALQHEEADGHIPDPTRFFSEEAILFGLADRRITEVVPGLLTMAGILGTFLGLVAGLHGLNPGAPNGLSAGIEQLIGGLSLKFTSSVYGIFFALLWLILDRLWWSRGLY